LKIELLKHKKIPVLILKISEQFFALKNESQVATCYLPLSFTILIFKNKIIKNKKFGT